jgi:serine/threonine protein kinase
VYNYFWIIEHKIVDLFFTNWFISLLNDVNSIGFGGYGRVYEAIRSDDGLPVVIKLIPKSGIVNWSSKQFSSSHMYNSGSLNSSAYLPFEIECLLRLRDTPGIIKIYDYFEESTCFVIVMEKLNRFINLLLFCYSYLILFSLLFN